MSVDIPKIIAVCGNPKCREVSKEPSMEFNFFTGEVVYVCSKCGYDSKINIIQEAKPFPKSRTMGKK